MWSRLLSATKCSHLFSLGWQLNGYNCLVWSSEQEAPKIEILSQTFLSVTLLFESSLWRPTWPDFQTRKNGFWVGIGVGVDASDQPWTEHCEDVLEPVPILAVEQLSLLLARSFVEKSNGWEKPGAGRSVAALFEAKKVFYIFISDGWTSSWWSSIIDAVAALLDLSMHLHILL